MVLSGLGVLVGDVVVGSDAGASVVLGLGVDAGASPSSDEPHPATTSTTTPTIADTRDR
jgi:hypothetical protein